MAEIHTLKDFLTDCHARIMDCEKRAHEALSNGNDRETYTQLMKQKAEMLARIDREARPWLAKADKDTARRVAARLQSFATSARRGLQIGSSFYWSALLWNDDARQGDPDNLQILINSLD